MTLPAKNSTITHEASDRVVRSERTPKSSSHRQSVLSLEHCNVFNFAHGSYDWLVARQGLVTASEIGIIMGYSSWSTALELYNSKKATITPEESDRRGSSRQQQFGLHMEQLMIEWVEQDLRLDKATLVNSLCISKEFPFAGATIDGLGSKDGELILLEFKTDQGYGDWGSKELPLQYKAQVNWQMLVTGVSLAYLCVLPHGSADKLAIIEVVRDDILIDLMLHQAKIFMSGLAANVPPPAKEGDLKNLPFNVDKQEYEPSSHFLHLYKLYKELDTQKASKIDGLSGLDKQIKDIKAQMAQEMGEYASSYFELDGKAVTVSRKVTVVPEKVVKEYTVQKINIKEE